MSKVDKTYSFVVESGKKCNADDKEYILLKYASLEQSKLKIREQLENSISPYYVDDNIIVGKKKGAHFGVIDHNGKIIVPFMYERIEYSEECLIAWLNKRCYLFDTNGDCVAELDERIEDVSLFGDGRAVVFNGSLINQCGYIDLDGKMITDFEFDSADSFSEGLACVSKGEKYGYINTLGELVIPYQFDMAYAFSDGLALVYDYESEKYGFIDKTGKLVIDYSYYYATGFSCGLAAVEDGENEYYINTLGEKVIEIKNSVDLPNIFKEGLALCEDGHVQYFIDTTGKRVFTIGSDIEISVNDTFSDGLLPVQQNGKWGFIDKNGKIAIPCTYDFVFPFENGYAIVSTDDNYMAINKKNRRISMIDGDKYREIISRIEGVCSLASNGILFAYNLNEGAIEPVKSYDEYYIFTNSLGETIKLDEEDIKVLKKHL